MDLRILCKDNRIFDLFYRLFLWGGLGFFLYWLGSKANGYGGEYISKAISTPPSSQFSQVVGGIGLVTAAIALLVKEASFGLRRRGNTTNIIHGITYCLSKLSSDLVLAPYNIMSFVLGWGIFLYSKNSFTAEQVGLAGILLAPYFSIMAFLAVVSLIVRTEEGETLHRKLCAQPLMLRLALYVTLLVVMALTLWLQK